MRSRLHSLTLSLTHSLAFSDELDGKDASGPDSFYKVYEPVFERNKRFAVILPAPSLGDEDAPIDEVLLPAGACYGQVFHASHRYII